ncbi:aminotransferase class IV [Phenylobacterium aquaticum]|uniref:aminotransferase class IV n=1 Tax=Phenylobacterium aquaticum TaxID=1763816 RepID=UPI0026EF8B77|nr:aminotransferase class IV [Phenylobacterium aquaticum]
MIPHDDRGLLLGDGLFETVLARDGVLMRLEAHLDRMAAGCAVLGLPAPDRGEATVLMRRALAGVEAPRVAVRLTLTAGSGGRGLDRPTPVAPRLFATAAPSAIPDQPARLALARTRRNDGSPAARIKSLSYLDNVLARAEARSVGADEAVMLNSRGEIACATAANIFWVSEGRLWTPALDCGALAGIARGEVMARAQGLGIEVAVARAGPQALERAQAIFLTNSLIGLRPVAAFGDRVLAPHPLADRLALN